MKRTYLRATSLSLLCSTFLLAACENAATGPDAASRRGGPSHTVEPFLLDPIVVDGCADDACADDDVGGGGGGGDYLPPPPPPEIGAGGGAVYSPDAAYGPGLWLACTAGVLASTSGIIVTNLQISDFWAAVSAYRSVQQEFRNKPWTAEGVQRYFAAKSEVHRQAWLLAATGLGTAATFLGAGQACSPGLVLPTP